MAARCPSVYFEAQDFTHRVETVLGIEMDEPPGLPPSRPRVTERRAAELLGLKLTTLQARRRAGTGPAFVKLTNGSALYYLDDLGAWAEQVTSCWDGSLVG
jgi:hypothetical protein